MTAGRRVTLVALLTVGCAASGIAAPAVAGAAGTTTHAHTTPSQAPLTSSTPLGGGITTPGAAPTTTATTPTVVNTSTAGGGGSGISSGTAIGIAVAAFVIIAGIAAAIFRDARSRTRGQRAPSADAERVPGSQRPPKARKLSPAERKRRRRGRAPRRR